MLNRAWNVDTRGLRDLRVAEAEAGGEVDIVAEEPVGEVELGVHKEDGIEWYGTA